MPVIVNEAFLRRFNELVNENYALKKQINDIEIEKVAKEVAKHINDWLDAPLHGKTTEQDLQEFSLKLTRYLDHRLKD